LPERNFQPNKRTHIIIIRNGINMAIFGFSSEITGVLFWATVGGVLVFIGLCMEKRIEVEHFSNINDLRRRRRTAHLGWWILMLGIVIEVADAGVVAIREELRARQLEAQLAWRTINAKQEAELIRVLTPMAQSLPKGQKDVVVDIEGGSEEAKEFALRIVDVLRKCGLDASLGMIGFGSRTGVGILFMVKNGNSPPPVALPILNAFTNILGGSIRAESEPRLMSDDLHIYVLPKPEK
jgi:hypothetical protein